MCSWARADATADGSLDIRTHVRDLAAIVVGAPLRLLADAVAARFALGVGVLGIAVSAVALAASGFRHATYDD